MKLHRHLGISYNAERGASDTSCDGSMQVMPLPLERDREHPLGGSIQLDDAYLGGERSGGKRGRKAGAPGKTPFVAAVERGVQRDNVRDTRCA